MRAYESVNVISARKKPHTAVDVLSGLEKYWHWVYINVLVNYNRKYACTSSVSPVHAEGV